MNRDVSARLLGNRAPRAPACTAVSRVALAAGLVLTCASAFASSHREAPFISGQPRVDGTDFYMFRSYEPGREGYVTLLANYSPLQDAYGGPNYFPLDANALYEIHVDNDGDAKEDLTFRFDFRNTSADVSLPIGGKQIAVPLIQVGPVRAGDSTALNFVQTYSVSMVRGDRRTGTSVPLTNATDGSRGFTRPADFIGQKTLGDSAAYAAYAAQYLYTVNIPGCTGQGRLFVGQRKDPFVIAVGRIFDLINLDPLGAPNANRDDLADKNVTTLALEVPISCLTRGDEAVIGGWTTASLRQGRLLPGRPGNADINGAETVGGAWAQVSRLGMPLTNEVVIGLKDKDRWNASRPLGDARFADYVTNPTLPALIQTLFPSAKAPTNFPRQDLVTVFLTGIKGVNQPKHVTPSEMLRLNTAIAPTPKGSQKNLGVLAGDNAGFPNGRRPGDDIVDVSLRVVMGVLCTLNDKATFGCEPKDAPAGGAALTDGASVDDSLFDATFPYVRTPLPGAPAP